MSHSCVSFIWFILATPGQVVKHDRLQTFINTTCPAHILAFPPVKSQSKGMRKGPQRYAQHPGTKHIQWKIPSCLTSSDPPKTPCMTSDLPGRRQGLCEVPLSHMRMLSLHMFLLRLIRGTVRIWVSAGKWPYRYVASLGQPIPRLLLSGRILKLLHRSLDCWLVPVSKTSCNGGGGTGCWTSGAGTGFWPGGCLIIEG